METKGVPSKKGRPTICVLRVSFSFAGESQNEHLRLFNYTIKKATVWHGGLPFSGDMIPLKPPMLSNMASMPLKPIRSRVWCLSSAFHGFDMCLQLRSICAPEPPVPPQGGQLVVQGSQLVHHFLQLRTSPKPNRPMASCQLWLRKLLVLGAKPNDSEHSASPGILGMLGTLGPGRLALS